MSKTEEPAAGIDLSLIQQDIAALGNAAEVKAILLAQRDTLKRRLEKIDRLHAKFLLLSDEIECLMAEAKLALLIDQRAALTYLLVSAGEQIQSARLPYSITCVDIASVLVALGEPEKGARYTELANMIKEIELADDAAFDEKRRAEGSRSASGVIEG